MMYLIDTCIFSEFTKAEPNPSVLLWAKNVKEYDQYLSVIVLGELLRGLERMPVGIRRDKLLHWVEGLFQTHQERIIPVNEKVVRIWAKLCAEAELRGKTPSAIDSLIASQAIAYKLSLVTRNVDDFQFPELSIINP